MFDFVLLTVARSQTFVNVVVNNLIVTSQAER